MTKLQTVLLIIAVAVITLIMLLMSVGWLASVSRGQNIVNLAQNSGKKAIDNKNMIMSITGYYHPLVGQKLYSSGSYKKDLKMNCWRGCEITNSGKKPQWGHIACPPQFKLGQELLIEGLGKFTCEDRGSAIKGNRIDVFTGEGIEGLLKAFKITKEYKVVVLK
jgi:3D (Asp-Asp-Asp) domain-containing protein